MNIPQDRMTRAILVGSKDSWQPRLETQLASYGIKVIGVWRNPADPGKRAAYLKQSG